MRWPPRWVAPDNCTVGVRDVDVEVNNLTEERRER